MSKDIGLVVNLKFSIVGKVYVSKDTGLVVNLKYSIVGKVYVSKDTVLVVIYTIIQDRWKSICE